MSGLVELTGLAHLSPTSRPTRVLEDIAHVRITLQKKTSAHHSIAPIFYKLLNRIFFVREKASWQAFEVTCKANGLDPEKEYGDRWKWASERVIHVVRSGEVLASELAILFSNIGPLVRAPSRQCSHAADLFEEPPSQGRALPER